MFILGKVKLLITVVLMLGLAGGVAYVYKLRGDNAILKSNQVKLNWIKHFKLIQLDEFNLV